MDDGQPLIERKENAAAVILRRVADQIDANNPDTFGGVAVIVPPQNGGDPIEVLIFDPKKNAAQFYATIQTRLQGQLADLDQQSRQNQAFRR